MKVGSSIARSNLEKIPDFALALEFTLYFRLLMESVSKYNIDVSLFHSGNFIYTLLLKALSVKMGLKQVKGL